MAVAAGAAALVIREREAADVAQARVLLLDGHAEQARALVARRLAWNPRRLDAVARVAGAMLGDRPARSSDGNVTGLDLAAIRRGLLRRGQYEACLRLAAASDAPAAALDRAAAALELGRADEARRALDAVASAATWPGLGREVSRVLRMREAGAATILRDRSGRLLGGLEAGGAFAPVEEIAPDDVPTVALEAARAAGAGGSLRLAQDLEPNRLARAALGTARGTIVLLDARTGDVLASASDERTLAAGGTPAFAQRREPASITKIVTTAAALRAGLDADAEIAAMTCRGFERYGDETLWCSFPAGRLAGLAHALAVSCNVAFANLAVKIGRAAVLDEFRRWGFDGPLPGAGRILEPEGDLRQLASLAIGLDATDVTPIHAALLATVARDEASMPAPRLLAARDGVLGLSPVFTPVPPARPVVDARTARILREAMRTVAEPGGTAAGAVPPWFPVAMKTGTAATPGLGYHVNYIGVGPLPHPTVAFCVRVTHQPTSGRVNRVAREVLWTLLDSLSKTRLP